MQNSLSSVCVKTAIISKLTPKLWANTIDIKENNPWNYSDNLCVCEESAELQNHIFHCKILKSRFDISEMSEIRELDYNDLFFGTIDKKVEITILFQARLKMRKLLMERRESETVAVDRSPSALGKPVEP